MINVEGAGCESIASATPSAPTTALSNSILSMVRTRNKWKGIYIVVASNRTGLSIIRYLFTRRRGQCGPLSLNRVRDCRPNPRRIALKPSRLPHLLPLHTTAVTIPEYIRPPTAPQSHRHTHTPNQPLHHHHSEPAARHNIHDIHTPKPKQQWQQQQQLIVIRYDTKHSCNYRSRDRSNNNNIGNKPPNPRIRRTVQVPAPPPPPTPRPLFPSFLQTLTRSVKARSTPAAAAAGIGVDGAAAHAMPGAPTRPRRACGQLRRSAPLGRPRGARHGARDCARRDGAACSRRVEGYG